MYSTRGRQRPTRAILAWTAPLLLALGACNKSDGEDPGGNIGVTGDLVLTARVSSSPPANVSLLFEATDQAGRPVANLLENGTIELQENGERVSPFESRQRIQPIGRQVAFPTLLLLDLSGSIVRSGNLPQLKESAKQFVATLLDPGSANADAREIAVAFFPGSSSGRGIQLISDFSTDITAIQERIDAVRGAPDTTTNLNEAILRGFERLDERQQEILERSEVEFTEGSLAVFTDGTDRAGTVSTEEVLAAIEVTDNRVFTIGLQGEIDEAVLRAIGKTGFVAVDDIENLQQRFGEVASLIRASANRFYAVEYCSPKRSGQHELTVIARVGSSSGKTVVTFDASEFRAGCRVPEGALELEGPSDASLHAATHDPASGGFALGGSVRGSASWFSRGRSASTADDAFLTVIVPPADDGGRATEVFTRVYPGDGPGSITSVATDGAGNVYVCGAFTASIDLGLGFLPGNGTEPTGFVAAIAPTGDTIWARQLGGPGATPAAALARSSDAVWVAGSFTQDLAIDGLSATSTGGTDTWLARFDPATGDCVDLIADGGPGDQTVTALTATRSGDPVFAGTFVDRAQFGGQDLPGSGVTAYVARRAADGAPRFATAFGADEDEEITAIREDLDGQLALVGSFVNGFDKDGTRVEPVGGRRTGFLMLVSPTDGGYLRHQTFGDASGAFETRATALGEDGIGNLYVAYAQSAPSGSGNAVVGFTMVLPNGERLLDYVYATDAAGSPGIAIGPIGLDQGVFTGSYLRQASFGPFPLRFSEPFDPDAPLGGVNAFVGFLGPRS